MSTLQLALVAIAAFFITRTLHAGLKRFKRNLAAVNHIPGYRIVFHPHVLFSQVLPRLGRFFNIGEQYTWRYKHDLFSQFNSDLVSIVSYVPHTRSIVTCDPEAIAFIVKERKKFPKPLGMYAALAMYGPNVGVTEGSEWTRHRRIVAGSNLLENINHLAWEHTMKTVELCLEDWQERMNKTGKRQVEVDSAANLTLKLALYVILGACFSYSAPWDDDAPGAIPSNHTMSLRHALHGVLTNIWWKIALPKFAYKLPFCDFFKHVGKSFDEFGEYMQEMVSERRRSGSTELEGSKRQDLLGALIQASGDSEKDDIDPEVSLQRTKIAKLTDREVIGNIYVFLLAGHDTTAHTLAFTLGLLALYPDIQQTTYESILEVLPSQSDELSYEKVADLKYCSAVFMETLRLYPSVVVIPKYSMENTLVPVKSFSTDGGKTTSEGTKHVLIPKYADVLLDVPGIHYNKRYWGEDAHDFKPERFIDDPEDGGKDGYKWPREAFMGFSQGARACLGQKFAQVEATTFIAEFIRRFEVVIDPKVLIEGESTEEARIRLLDGCKTVITLTPKPLPVIFKERAR